MTNEEHTEELLHKAHKLGFYNEMMKLSARLMEKKIERHHAFHMAYLELKKEYNEIHGKRHPGQGEVGEDDREGSSSNL